MGTEPIKSILSRDITNIHNKKIFRENSDYIKEINNFFTITINDFLLNTKEQYKTNENIALPMILFHTLEASEAIRILISQGFPSQCFGSLRSIFESYLSIRLILEDMSEFVKRSLCWLVYGVNENLKTYRRIDSGYLERINLKNEIKIPQELLWDKEPIKKKISLLERLLKRNQFAEINEIYTSSKSRNWYGLVDCHLNNIRDLSKRFNSEMEYELLYKQYSKHVHVTEYKEYISRLNDQYEYVLPNRAPLKEITGWTGKFMFFISRQYIKTFYQIR